MKKKQLGGFTLVEIMIVVLIIGILLAIAIPNFMRARENSLKARQAVTKDLVSPYIGNITGHADQLVGRTFTVCAADKAYNGAGWVVHLKDDSGHYDDLFVAGRFEADMSSFYVEDAKLTFTRVTPQYPPTRRVLCSERSTG